MSEVTFLSMPDSAYLWTAMHVADEKGVPYAFEPLVYRSEEHLRLHPFGKMPVMRHGDFVLYETLAIACYLDAAFDGPAHVPHDAKQRAETMRWVSIVNSYIFPIMNRFMKERIVRPAWGFEPDAAFIQDAREPILLQMRLMDDSLNRNAFLAGPGISIADSFALPHLLFFGLTPEGEALIEHHGAVRRWLDSLCSRASFTANPMRSAFGIMRNGVRPKASVWSPPV